MTTKLFYCKIYNKGTFEPMNMFKIIGCMANIEDVKQQADSKTKNYRLISGVREEN